MNKPSPQKNIRVKLPKPKKASNKMKQVNKQVSAPTAKGKVRTSPAPIFNRMPNGDVLIVHREFVSDIFSSQDFITVNFPVNPGLTRSFPWLSVVAFAYESYIFERLEYRFETSSPTSTPGYVILTLDYDPDDPAPATKQQAMAYRRSVRSPPWSSSDHSSIREDLNKRKSYFLRRGAVGGDSQTYDVGTFYVGTGGQGVDDTVIGELYVEYSVRLMTPQLGDLSIGLSLYAYFHHDAGVPQAFSNKGGNLPGTIIYSGSDDYTLSISTPWQGVMSIYLEGTGLSAGTLFTPSGGSCILLGEAFSSGTPDRLAVIASINAQGSALGITTILIEFASITSISMSRMYLAQSRAPPF